MYNSDGYDTLNELMSNDNSASKNNVLDILQRISTECLLPFTTRIDLFRLLDQAESKAPILAELKEWKIAKTAIAENNFSAVAMQVSACIQQLKLKKK